MALQLDLGNLIAHLKLDKRQWDSTITAISKKMAAMGRTTTQLMARWGRRSALATAAYVGVSIKAFASFEEQIANVSTMLDDQTMHYLPGYSRAIQQMSVDFGDSTESLSKGLYDILSASVAPAKALNVLTAAAKAAKAGLTSTAVSADAITTILNSYSLSADKASDVSDFLFAVVKRGKTTFAELAPNIGKVASIASTASLSLEEMGAALATMTRAGLRTDIAITSLRSMLNSFLSPTDGAKKAARDLGIQLNTAALKGNGLQRVLLKLKDATAEQIAELIPATRALAGAAAAIKNVSGYVDDLNFMMERAGLTEIAYAKMTDTLAHSMRQLWNALKVVSVHVGSRFRADMISLSDAIVDNMDTISDWAVFFSDRIVFVKDVLWELIKWIRKDWLEAWANVTNALIELLKATGWVLVDLGIRIGRGIGRGILAGIKNVWYERRNEMKGLLTSLESVFPMVGALGKLIPKADEYTPPETVQEGIMEGFGEKTAATFKKAWDAIKTETLVARNLINEPLEELKLKDQTREAEKNLRQLGGMFGALGRTVQNWWVSPIAKSVEETEKLAEGMKAVEHTMPTASAEIQEMLKALDTELQLQGLINEERERAVALERFKTELSAQFVEGTKEYMYYLDQYIEKLNQLIEGPQGWDALWMKMRSASREAQNQWAHLGDIMVDATQKAGNAFSDMIIKGRADWRSIVNDVLEGIIRMHTQAMMYQVLGGLFGQMTTAPIAKTGSQTPTQLAPKADAWLNEMPAFGDGGVVNRPTVAVVGERPEAIMPLDEMGQMGGTTVNHNYYIKAFDSKDVARVVRENQDIFASGQQASIRGNHPVRRTRRS